jgi:hypothetical protein
MRRMGIEALYRHPRTTKPEPGHKIYPYLLRGMEITRPNQVWAMDITYIPMARGFVYLSVVLDWFSRRVLSWRASITMEAAFCVETLEDALARHGRPDTSIQIKVRSSRERPSPACSPTMTLRSAWTARGHGGTTCSSSGYGAASNTRRCICGPMTASARPALRLVATWTSITPATAFEPWRHDTRSSLLHPAANPDGSLTPADAPLIDAENMFTQPGPPLPEVAQL